MRDLEINIESVTPRFSSLKKRHASSDNVAAHRDEKGTSVSLANTRGDELDADAAVQRRISNLVQEPVNTGGVTLTTAGMAAIFSSLRLVQADWEGQGRRIENAHIVVFGFPYLDTLKACKIICR